ncbi:hypothetical protein ACC676_07580 [Rhizobium ruizarguesonis]|uniref:hypothetical protein n=1 Tax=Rhizobium ruizarguesonis TaxID=2081791 RepID=UPI0013EEA386|nr:hypothetical protein [Rhizobium ruizarguesonis]
MKVAALAYEQLTPAARAEANTLVRLNPDYPQWVAAGVPADIRETFTKPFTAGVGIELP